MRPRSRGRWTRCGSRNITQYLKEGYKLQFITPARQLGRGTHAVVRLPAGVPAAEIAQAPRRPGDRSAPGRQGGLADHRRRGRNPGSVDRRQGRARRGCRASTRCWPRVWWTCSRVSRRARRCAVTQICVPVMGRNTIAGGMPGQGKSSRRRGRSWPACALDPTAELRIWVPDTNFDFELFKPRCSRYVMGADDDSMQARSATSSGTVRGDAAARRPADGYEIPRSLVRLADKTSACTRWSCLLEEAHVAYPARRATARRSATTPIEIVQARPQARHPHDHLDPGTDRHVDARATSPATAPTASRSRSVTTSPTTPCWARAPTSRASGRPT